jgi:hypothetical protein
MSKYNLIDIYEQFKPGDKFSTDFDYDEMLRAGLKTGVDTDLNTLKALSDSFEDVNYHTENHHLQNAIEALEDGAEKEAAMFFGDFHAEIKATIEKQGMDIEPTVGQFMASKMEEGEEVEEVTSREGSRMESLVDQRMKAKFLEVFADLYFNLTDKDPFQAEDVVDYLGIEMLKHLDAIQAQGDILNSTNTDADFEREQRMQMDMREEEMSLKDIIKSTKVDGNMIDLEKAVMAKAKKSGLDVTDKEVEDAVEKHADMALGLMEELAPTGIAISQKQLDDLKKLGAISGLEVMVQDKDGSNVRKVDYTLTNTDFEKGDDDYDYLDENLKEHFGRFMKDYQ